MTPATPGRPGRPGKPGTPGTPGTPATHGLSRLRVHERDGVVCIEFIDRNILDEANIQRIGDEISRIVDEQRVPRLLINFENVDHLSSAALGTLITINNKVRSKDGQMRLAGIDPQIYEIFRITKLDRIFKVHDTTEDAMKAFT